MMAQLSLNRRTIGALHVLAGMSADPTRTDVLMNGDLAELAREYARTYDGDFVFMMKMRQIARRGEGFSLGQLAAILRCLRPNLPEIPALPDPPAPEDPISGAERAMAELFGDP